MTKLISISTLFLACLTAFGSIAAAADDIAVVYFSKYENVRPGSVDSVTRASYVPQVKSGAVAYAANIIASETGAKVFPLKVEKPYPASFDEVVAQNHEEQTQGTLPKLVAVPDLTRFNTVYLGFPIWSMDIPQPVKTFLKQAKLSSKEVIPFSTHDGYGSGSSFVQVQRALPESKVTTDGLEIHSSRVAASEKEIKSWLQTHKPVAVSADNTISCKVAGKTIRIRLNNSPEAQQFRKQLPVKVRMGEFGGREFYGPHDGEISVSSKGQYTFEDGTLTYCPTNNTVAIFYAQSSRPHLTMAVYPMGKVVSDLSVFQELPSYTTFEFSE